MVRATFLSAKDNPKAYEKDWERLVVELREMLEDPEIKERFPNIDTSLLYSDDSYNTMEQGQELYEQFMTENVPVVIIKQYKPEKFIEPNKPMYRIFDIDDMKEINGFTGDFFVQEKYDGLRVQVHKFNNEVKIYSFNGRDITNKFEKCVKVLEERTFPNCILDGEAVLYKGDEPLVRADTLAFINRKVESEGDIKLHIFDIMYFEDESIAMEKLEERMQTLISNFSAHSDERVMFPNKKNTREADSMEEIEEYALEIMINPTSEGVVIKDAKSSYIIGKKKNPKWIKWKKFVDLDVIVLAVKENKNGTFGYTIGVGPVEEGTPKAFELESKFYMNLGKTTNTNKEVEVGKVIRVKADEIMGNPKKGFSLFNSKFHEIPEAAEPEKLITLEFLTKDGKKSLGDYTIDALTKSYTITDKVHGVAKFDTDLDLEGFVFHGFKDKNLMSKNAMINKDMWEKQLKAAYGKDNGKFFVFVQQLLENRTLNDEQIFKEAVKYDSKMMSRLFGEKDGLKKMRDRLKKGGKAYGIESRSSPTGSTRFSYDSDSLAKAVQRNGKFQLWANNDRNLYFVIDYKDDKMIWKIDTNSDEEVYDLLGEAGKYPAIATRDLEQKILLDKGKLILGAQRNDYHEYIIKGEDIVSKLHVRYLPVDGKEMFLAWTGYENKPTSKSSDEGKIDIYDKN